MTDSTHGAAEAATALAPSPRIAQASQDDTAPVAGDCDAERTVLTVHENANGYWYIGAGRSIAEGPYRHPQQLLVVASDLLAAELRWRIDVFDAAGGKVISYSSDQLSVGDLHPLGSHRQWIALARNVRH